MEIGDRVQTLNTLCPITGQIVDMYKNLVTIAGVGIMTIPTYSNVALKRNLTKNAQTINPTSITTGINP